MAFLLRRYLYDIYVYILFGFLSLNNANWCIVYDLG